MSDTRKITICKHPNRAKIERGKDIPREVLKEVEALECELGRINKRLATLKELLKAA